MKTHRCEEVNQPGLFLMTGEVLRSESGHMGIDALFSKSYYVIQGIFAWENKHRASENSSFYNWT